MYMYGAMEWKINIVKPVKVGIEKSTVLGRFLP